MKDAWISKVHASHVPKHFVSLDQLPYTPNGKRDFVAIQKLNENSASVSVPEAEALQSSFKDAPLLSRLRALCLEVFEVSTLEESEDFITAGVNSLQILRLGNRLKTEFGSVPPAQDLFKDRTLRGLFQFYAQHGEATSSPSMLLTTQEERDRFKRERFAQRARSPRSNSVSGLFEDRPTTDLFRDLKSTRNFSNAPIEPKLLGRWLDSLALSLENGKPKAAYPSAGGLYPVQVYLHVKSGAVKSLLPGTYFFDALERQLTAIPSHGTEERSFFFGESADLEARAPITLYLIADMTAIEPLYAASSLQYCHVEAGAMTQLLRMSSRALNLGTCFVSECDSRRLLNHLHLDARHHSHLGTIFAGAVESAEETEWITLDV
jgi:SagB-type dehydrogenase family enzyme